MRLVPAPEGPCRDGGTRRRGARCEKASGIRLGRGALRGAGSILDPSTGQTFRYVHILAATTRSRMLKEGHAEELMCSARYLQREQEKSPID